MTYGHFLGGGCGRSDGTQIVRVYGKEILTKSERVEVIELMKKEEYARQYYFYCLHLEDLVI